MPDSHPADPKPRILSTTNCYAPDGATRCVIITRADGTTEFFGNDPDKSLAKAPLAALRSIDLRRCGNHRS